MAASRAKLINDEGDSLMYGPAESYAPPTLTGGKYRNSIPRTHSSLSQMTTWTTRGSTPPKPSTSSSCWLTVAMAIGPSITNRARSGSLSYVRHAIIRAPKLSNAHSASLLSHQPRAKVKLGLSTVSTMTTL